MSDASMAGMINGEEDDGGMSVRDDDLDEEFPLGDGTAETGAAVRCPYCGEINEIALDPGSGNDQRYIEDCQVCCRPWTVMVQYQPDGSADVSLDVEDLG
ncbi:MAG TPA: CPXCG motif-containing cysteine-rich protein [Gemmatimonadales bacterium]|nr:CPXCG motif-containing cysteine-rich protein [Gemmatimonadales bacterium]